MEVKISLNVEEPSSELPFVVAADAPLPLAPEPTPFTFSSSLFLRQAAFGFRLRSGGVQRNTTLMEVQRDDSLGESWVIL